MRRQHQFSHIIELNCFALLYGFLYVTSIKHVDHVPSLASITRVSAQNPLRNWIVKSEEKMLKEKEKERKNKWYSNGKEKLKEFCSFFFFFHASKKSRRINWNHTHTHKNRANHLITAAGSTHSRQTDFRQEIYLSIYLSKWLWLQFISRSALHFHLWRRRVCYYSIRSFQMIFSRIFIVLRLSSQTHRQREIEVSFHPKRRRCGFAWLFFGVIFSLLFHSSNINISAF